MSQDEPWVQLIGIGRFRAKKAAEFVPGNTIVYNFGETGKVISINPKGKSVFLETENKGKRYKTRKNKDTLMGWMP